jgi:hypothetical protein
MIVAFEILRNSGSSGYHNETTMNFETEAKDDPTPRKLRKHKPFGTMRRRFAVDTVLSRRDE